MSAKNLLIPDQVSFPEFLSFSAPACLTMNIRRTIDRSCLPINYLWKIFLVILLFIFFRHYLQDTIYNTQYSGNESEM